MHRHRYNWEERQRDRDRVIEVIIIICIFIVWFWIYAALLDMDDRLLPLPMLTAIWNTSITVRTLAHYTVGWSNLSTIYTVCINNKDRSIVNYQLSLIELMPLDLTSKYFWCPLLLYWTWNYLRLAEYCSIWLLMVFDWSYIIGILNSTKTVQKSSDCSWSNQSIQPIIPKINAYYWSMSIG